MWPRLASPCMQPQSCSPPPSTHLLPSLTRPTGTPRPPRLSPTARASSIGLASPVLAPRLTCTPRPARTLVPRLAGLQRSARLCAARRPPPQQTACLCAPWSPATRGSPRIPNCPRQPRHSSPSTVTGGYSRPAGRRACCSSRRCHSRPQGSSTGRPFRRWCAPQPPRLRRARPRPPSHRVGRWS